ncbi:MAG: hypothetical protein HYY84_19395 [Deltaproteobacteria bacterium]|nr:hypothetical protein [Deltaproteobacteria bacterium]
MYARVLSLVAAVSIGNVISTAARGAESDLHLPSEPRGEVTVSIRGGALTLPASTYRADAEAFGFTGLGNATGFTAHAGYEIRDRVVLGATYSRFTTKSMRRTSTLSLEMSALLGGVQLTIARAIWGEARHWRLLFDGSVAAGMYFLDEKFDSRTRSVQGYGVRVGADLGIFYRSAGFVMSFAYHGSDATLFDLIGGKMDAAGFEVTAGLALRI